MNEGAIYLTTAGEEKIIAELEVLRGPRRQELAGRLRHAVSMGDLSENADYIAAKEEQAFLEGRILELETILRTAIRVRESGSNGIVRVGSTVVVSEGGRPEETYQLVGITEANPREGKISNMSPIGKALLGKQVGDEAVAQTPLGHLHFKIIAVK